MDLSIIIVNWNSLDYLRECIASIYENTHGITFEILAVDNASTIGDIDTLTQTFPDVILIKAPHNMGFARANNLGFTNSWGSHLLFLNPDTTLVGPAITILLKHLKALPEAGILGCKHINPDFTIQTTSIQKFPTLLTELLAIEYLRLRWPSCPLWDIGPLFDGRPGPVRVQAISGACMMLTRKVFEQVGMFSEEYFMYAEDIDLNHKIARAGFKNYYIPEAVIVHYGGRSAAQQAVNQWATTMKLRAMRKYYTKTHGRIYAALYRTIVSACAVARLVLIALALLLGDRVWHRDVLRRAFDKWIAVLKWGVGLDASDVSGAC